MSNCHRAISTTMNPTNELMIHSQTADRELMDCPKSTIRNGTIRPFGVSRASETNLTSSALTSVVGGWSPVTMERTLVQGSALMVIIQTNGIDNGTNFKGWTFLCRASCGVTTVHPV